MNFLLKSLFKVSLACVAMVMTTSAQALMIYTLDSSTATLVAGNAPTSGFFYKYDTSDTPPESGLGAPLLSTAYGGDASSGYTALITWGTSPQPLLTAAYLKASNAHLFWDSADLAAFNAGTYNGLMLVQNGLGNRALQYQAVSHVQLDGSAIEVPDSGMSLSMFGAASLGLIMLVRRQK